MIFQDKHTGKAKGDPSLLSFRRCFTTQKSCERRQCLAGVDNISKEFDLLSSLPINPNYLFSPSHLQPVDI